MKILVVGGGGREHAIIDALSKSPKVDALFACPGNGGISKLATCLPVDATDIEGVIKAAKDNAVDLVFVAPDDPLVLGMVDALEANGIRAFGPNKAAAAVEGSKVFSKHLMKTYGIPTAAYEIFDSSASAIAYIKEQNSFPAVIKADGLAKGKGVIIAADLKEAEEAVHSIMEDKIFGASGNRVVVEEFLTGPEVSVLAFTDGKTMVPMVSAQDHKRAFDNDEGPNTGGMGAFSPSKIYTEELAKVCYDTIFLPTMNALNAEGRTFKGVLYFGLMITAKGPMVIEYNARFGDPETQAVLPRLKTDLVDIMEAIIDQKLDQVSIEWSDEQAVCLVLASGGYPGKYENGKEIRGLDAFEGREDVFVYHAGTKMADGKCLTAGGRVLGVVAKAPTMTEAIDKVYAEAAKISFENMHFRRDIGRKNV
ncbi:MAG: phosphoribosylamine--glycine ligase [Ruminococcaceae bacterium]|nr:phosphoribosylamine--glycine ligase [Oscillospiraceae bacterium]